MGEGKKTEGEKESRQRKIAKFTGTLEMDAALDRMVRTVNDGFSGGRVSKHELVSWAVLYFEKQCFPDCLEKLRSDHFDQVAHLESVLKQAKLARKSGADAAEVAVILGSVVPGGRTVVSRRGRR